MTLVEAFAKIKTIIYPVHGFEVEKTVAGLIQSLLAPQAQMVATENLSTAKGPGILHVVVSPTAEKTNGWMRFRLGADGGGELTASRPAFLYALFSKIQEELLQEDVTHFANGKTYEVSFAWHRPLFDYLLTQSWRSARGVDPEEHIRHYARLGYTHLEVNGLATHIPYVERVPEEYYSQFYTYCAALDQFVESRLNQGMYPPEYLNANLNQLKKYAALARKYGLRPGILCFEPRTVPEKLFERYPMLRGARVDHPMRSWLPRYTLAISHPAVQDHYAELMRNLLKEVPELDYMSVWTNDSGSGFEHTASLYVGRNGGAYLIREWRNHEKVAEAAGKNAVNWLRVLHHAAAEINPDFRVCLRIEPFKVEHDVIVRELEKGLDIEVPSLLVRGYDLPYAHPVYPEIKGVAGSAYHLNFDTQEKPLLEKFRGRQIEPHFVYSRGTGYTFEPLLGIPYPWMTYEKLKAASDLGASHLAHMGGGAPPTLTPYNINQEMWREFQFSRKLNVDETVNKIAQRWVGEKLAGDLVQVWKLAEQAIRHIPPLPLYSGFGYVWYRLWVRPFVPNFEAVPKTERAYYEKFLVSVPNNPSMVDLGRDVLFDLISKEYGEKYVERVDANVWQPLEAAIALADSRVNASPVFLDQRDRLRGLRCWVGTARSTAMWVAGVYGYLAAADAKAKENSRAYLRKMMTVEIQFAKDLLQLWETSNINWMVVSKVAETSYIYGENMGELIRKKIALMEKYGDVEPYIDPNFMWRVPGYEYEMPKRS
ncbi:MAG: hypothetical protein ALAOOOJD_01568 [bacterium]|nr:hypothetical protein [bacterium]